ncbi:MAG: hypothetical protein PHS52_05985 [Desulfotomaculaceae bacterium]|nr:hypothetical protein [Desulfotomaculaceae bacterium]
MELKLGGRVAERAGDELIQKMLEDILAGLKKKMVLPVVEGNLKLAGRIEELESQNRSGLVELAGRLETLEDEVRQLPLIILAALRDAINQAGGGNQDEE